MNEQIIELLQSQAETTKALLESIKLLNERVIQLEKIVYAKVPPITIEF